MRASSQGRPGNFTGCEPAAMMHWPKRSPFPIVYNVGDMAQGWEIVERLAGHPDRFIPGHDPIVSEIYPRASDKVDAFALHLAPSRSFAE